MKRNLSLQCSDSSDESTGRVPHVNHQFVLGTSVLLPMAVFARARVCVCVCKGKAPAELVGSIRQSFVRSPHKSLRRAVMEFNAPKTSVWQVLWKHLRLRPYQLQILQQLKPTDKVKRYDFCCSFLRKLADDDTIMNKLAFSDEATFRLPGRGNRHNLRI
jgi:hypothetical protein